MHAVAILCPTKVLYKVLWLKHSCCPQKHDWQITCIYGSQHTNVDGPQQVPSKLHLDCYGYVQFWVACHQKQLKLHGWTHRIMLHQLLLDKKYCNLRMVNNIDYKWHTEHKICLGVRSVYRQPAARHKAKSRVQCHNLQKHLRRWQAPLKLGMHFGHHYRLQGSLYLEVSTRYNAAYVWHGVIYKTCAFLLTIGVSLWPCSLCASTAEHLTRCTSCYEV